MNVTKIASSTPSTKSPYTSVAKHTVSVFVESADWQGKKSLKPYGSTKFFIDEKEAEKEAERLARSYASTPTYKVVFGTIEGIVTAPAPVVPPVQPITVTTL